jgi:hypothetical protein
METFYELQPDIFGEHVPELVEPLPSGVTFGTGSLIQEALPSPLVFETDHTVNDPPKAMHNLIVPIMSDAFIAALQQIGVSNVQRFPAEVRSRVDATVWKNYQAVNVVGLIACADLEASEFTHIADRPGESAAPLLEFEDLKIDPARAGEALLFSLAESPGTILIAGRVVEHIRAQRSDEEWGITLDER